MALLDSNNNMSMNQRTSKTTESEEDPAVDAATDDSSHKHKGHSKMSENMGFNYNGMPFVPFCSGRDNDYSNQWMNNPFIYLVLLWLFGNNGFGGGFGRNGFGVGTGAAVSEAVGAQNLMASQVDDIRTRVAQVASEVSCGNRTLDGLQQACNGLGLQISNLKDATTSALCQIGHQIDVNGLNVISKIQECCCATGERICNVEKEMLRQTNTISNGFAQLGFQGEKNTNSVVQAIQTESCNTRELIQALHNQDIIALKDSQIAALQDRVGGLSQSAQTATILAAINAKSTTTTSS